MVEVALSVGSNADRVPSIRKGVQALTEHFGAVSRSPVFESAAEGFDGEPFYNLVVTFTTRLALFDLRTTLRSIECLCGRSAHDRGFKSRSLDLDLLLYGDQVLQTEELRLPHEDIEQYAFVLRPLAELMGGRKHPRTGVRFGEMWAAMEHTAVPTWRVPFDWT
ncbi:MAG: 2-amino-4-hydroxy-6-hydroxymethyldihydropteridine diphosphokinase [Gammaproteobacteria bacterium]|nr:2-amino-4-hydroxy-6-hydroxymethyldihydropteridine diphosphokinase [Gammaproteobacteria bacterium]